MSEVTRLIELANQGDPRAAEELLPLVYEELRKLAAVRMASEAPGHTLDGTGLVHEAFLRLVGDQRFENRSHFFAAAAEAMRRILVESARAKSRLKRGGDQTRVTIDAVDIRLQRPADELLAIHEALDRLTVTNPRAAELVKLRYFVGLTLDEAAQTLGISPRTADGVWAYAKAWLLVQLGPAD